MNKYLFLRNVASTVACLAVLTVISSCSKDKKDDEPKSITVADTQQLTQTVYADKTTGKSSVNITTTGAWTSSIAEAPATRAAAPTWITISPSSGNAAGAYAIAITLEPNYSGADRSAVITISCAGQQIVINLTQTSKKEDGTTPVEPFIVTGSIVDIPDTVTVTHIKLMGDDREGDDEVLATAPYQNGSFTMTLPATIDNKFLETFDDAPDGVTVSAPDAKMLEDLSFDAYNGSELLGGTYLGTDNENIDVQLFYIDRDCAITGTGTDERNGETETAHYEMNLKAGWNWLYAIFNDDGSMTLTTTKPNNVTVKWFWGH